MSPDVIVKFTHSVVPDHYKHHIMFCIFHTLLYMLLCAQKWIPSVTSETYEGLLGLSPTQITHSSSLKMGNILHFTKPLNVWVQVCGRLQRAEAVCCLHVNYVWRWD